MLFIHFISGQVFPAFRVQYCSDSDAEQNSFLYNTLCISPKGFENSGLVGPNNAIDGTSKAPAICNPTESFPINKTDGYYCCA